MATERTITLPALVRDRLIQGSAARNVGLVIAGSLLIALSAQVAVPTPFSPVPLTLQPLALLLVAATLGSVRGASAAALYLLEGLSGLPVFATPPHAGPLVLAGPSAGYLFAFPAAAWLAGWFSENGRTRSVPLTAAGMLLALAVVHLGGWSWLAAVIGLGAQKAFLVGTVPFLLGDVIKAAIAAVILPAAQKFVGRT